MNQCKNCIFRFEDEGKWFCCAYGFEKDRPIDLDSEACEEWKGSTKHIVH